MMKEHDVVVLRRDLPEHRLLQGDMGAIVYIYGEHEAYEVEFVAGSGETVALLTLEPSDIRELGGAEILHARSIPAVAGESP